MFIAGLPYILGDDEAVTNTSGAAAIPVKQACCFNLFKLEHSGILQFFDLL